TRALGNTNGVEVRGPNSTVAGNLIAGNRNYGVFLASTGATDNGVLGNLIGTDATGTAALGNRAGVVVTGPNNRIGGTEFGAGNVISGNLEDGIDLESGGNTVQGNFVGTDATGTAALGNGMGVSVRGTGRDNRIGGPSAAARNVISGNRFEGVLLF